jgi:hypothetical protein
MISECGFRNKLKAYVKRTIKDVILIGFGPL